MIEIVHIDDDNFTILMKYKFDEDKDFEFRELLYRGGSDQTECGEYHMWEKGEYIRSKLKEMHNVSEVRGQGLMIGIVTEKDNAKEIAAKCVENGLLILTAKNLLRLLPPLNITYDELDKGLSILKTVMEA